MAVKPVYFDYNATTPVDPVVLEAMLPYFSQVFGNASSRSHPFGWAAAEAVEIAREQVAALIGATPSEMTFTSGATESLNLALKGIAHRYQTKGKHLISFVTEHKAVLETLRYLSETGWQVELLPVDRTGLPDVDQLRKAIRPDTVLIAAMLANNETGVIWPIRQMSELAREKGVIMVCDATQACGKIPVNVQELGVDVLALSAHKFYGPKGCGALFSRRRNPRVALEPLIHGGGHEGGLRSGTLNVPGIVGMGKAAEIASAGLVAYSTLTSGLRDLFEQELLRSLPVHIHGQQANRLPNTTSVQFEGMLSSRLIPMLPAFALSTGSACSSALPEPSHVLTAMGCSEKQAYESVRLSLGKYSHEEEIRACIGHLQNILGV